MSIAAKKRKPNRKGVKLTAEHRAKISASMKGRGVGHTRNNGENHPNWKGGITPENIAFRKSRDYVIWRTAVFTRDDYVCQICGKRGGQLEADHIKPFSLFPELRLAIDNGRTLCKECHKSTDTYAGRIRGYQV